jgi:hypothetical protein
MRRATENMPRHVIRGPVQPLNALPATTNPGGSGACPSHPPARALAGLHHGKSGMERLPAREQPPVHAEAEGLEADAGVERPPFAGCVQGDARAAALPSARERSEDEISSVTPAPERRPDTHVVDAAGVTLDVEDGVTGDLGTVPRHEVVHVVAKHALVPGVRQAGEAVARPLDGVPWPRQLSTRVDAHPVWLPAVLDSRHEPRVTDGRIRREGILRRRSE